MANLRAVATAGSGQSAGVNSLSITVPTTGPGGAVVAGDVAVITLITSASAVTLTTPTGWTALYTADNDASTTLTWVLYKTLVSGDIGAAVTLGLSAFTRADANMVVVGSATTSGLLSGHTLNTTAATSVVAPSVASVPAGAFVLEVFAGRANAAAAATLTMPSGITSTGATVTTAYTTAPNNTIAAGYELAPTAGTQGGDTATWSAACNGASYTVVLPSTSAPASGTGSITLAGAATAQASPTVSGTLSLGGTATPLGPHFGGAISLAGGPVAAQAGAGAAGAITLGGSGGAPQARASAAGSLTLGGAPAAQARASSIGGLVTLSGGPASGTARYLIKKADGWHQVIPKVWDGAGWLTIPVTIVPSIG